MKTTNKIIPPPDSIHYRLLCIKTGEIHTFRIYVRYRDDQIILPLPTQDKEKAKEWYRLIVKACVTPCTLSDVLQDLQFEN